MIIVASIVMMVGAFFALVAAIGVVRMPDIYCRMHAATKAGAFGVGLILTVLLLIHPSVRVVVQSGLIVVFFYLTAPIAAHLIGRLALQSGIPLWRKWRVEGEEQPPPTGTGAP